MVSNLIEPCQSQMLPRTSNCGLNFGFYDQSREFDLVISSTPLSLSSDDKVLSVRPSVRPSQYSSVLFLISHLLLPSSSPMGGYLYDVCTRARAEVGPLVQIGCVDVTVTRG